MEFRVNAKSESWDCKTRRDGGFFIAVGIAWTGPPMFGFAGTWGTKSKYSPLRFEPTGVGVVGLREVLKLRHLFFLQRLEVGSDVDVFSELFDVVDANDGGADGQAENVSQRLVHGGDAGVAEDASASGNLHGDDAHLFLDRNREKVVDE